MAFLLSSILHWKKAFSSSSGMLLGSEMRAVVTDPVMITLVLSRAALTLWDTLGSHTETVLLLGQRSTFEPQLNIRSLQMGCYEQDLEQLLFIFQLFVNGGKSEIRLTGLGGYEDTSISCPSHPERACCVKLYLVLWSPCTASVPHLCLSEPVWGSHCPSLSAGGGEECFYDEALGTRHQTNASSAWSHPGPAPQRIPLPTQWRMLEVLSLMLHTRHTRGCGISVDAQPLVKLRCGTLLRELCARHCVTTMATLHGRHGSSYITHSLV